MIEQGVRRYYQKLFVDPVAIRLKDRIRPNTVTWLSGLLGVLVIPALLFNQVLLATGLLLLSGYCDTLDGTLARFTHHSTAWGSVLDIMMDRLVEFSAVFGLWLVDPNHRALWCFLMLGSMLLCITSFLVVGIFIPPDLQVGLPGKDDIRGKNERATGVYTGVHEDCERVFDKVDRFSWKSKRKSFHYSPGIMERAEAFIFFVAMMWWPSAFIPLALLFSFLVILTAIIRLTQFYQQTRSTKQTLHTVTQLESVPLNESHAEYRVKEES